MCREDVERLAKQKKTTLGAIYALLNPYVFFYKKQEIFNEKGRKPFVATIYNMKDHTVRAKSGMLDGLLELFHYMDNEEIELVKAKSIEKGAEWIPDIDIHKLPSNQKMPKPVGQK